MAPRTAASPAPNRATEADSRGIPVDRPEPPEMAVLSPSPARPFAPSEAEAPDTPDARHLWDALRDVMDPELPLSIVDLGLVYAVHADAGLIEVELTYTATGCPCMEFIHEDVRARLLREPGVTEVRIRDVWDPPWTPARISAEGRAALRRHGVAA